MTMQLSPTHSNGKPAPIEDMIAKYWKEDPKMALEASNSTRSTIEHRGYGTNYQTKS